jgi:hypothetical protein
MWILIVIRFQLMLHATCRKYCTVKYIRCTWWWRVRQKHVVPKQNHANVVWIQRSSTILWTMKENWKVSLYYNNTVNSKTIFDIQVTTNIIIIVIYVVSKQILHFKIILQDNWYFHIDIIRVMSLIWLWFYLLCFAAFPHNNWSM